MKEYFPALLSRRQAMAFTNKGRKALENFINRNEVRSFKTKGGHNRYNKEDISKAITLESKKQ